MDEDQILRIPEVDSIAWDYDEEADVLYISFGDPRPAIAIDIDGVLVRYTEGTGEIVGVTIIGVGDMLKKKKSPGRASAVPPK